MTSPTITDADANAAADFLEGWEPGPEMTVVKLARAFAAHREQARREALEEAARVAEAQWWDRIGDDQAGDIAAAIRALI